VSGLGRLLLNRHSLARGRSFDRRGSDGGNRRDATGVQERRDQWERAEGAISSVRKAVARLKLSRRRRPGESERARYRATADKSEAKNRP